MWYASILLRATLALTFLELHMCQTIHNYAGTTVEVLGQSGKARITRGQSECTFMTDYLAEVDGTGNEVCKTSNPKHSIQTFATQDFTFSTLVERKFQNLTAREFAFETPINTIGKLKIVTVLFNEEGSVKTETETWNVNPGDLKWNIELTDWTFCDQGTTEFIDVGVEIKGSKNEAKGNQTTDLGDAVLQLSNRIIVDGKEEYMTSGYPKVVQSGSQKQLYIFRFPKFSTTATYDPLLQLVSSNTPRVTQLDRRYPLLLLLACLPLIS